MNQGAKKVRERMSKELITKTLIPSYRCKPKYKMKLSALTLPKERTHLTGEPGMVLVAWF